MKQLTNISSDLYFYLLLAMLLVLNVSIAANYIFFTVLCVGFLIDITRRRKLPQSPGFFKYMLIYFLCTMISTVFAINRWHSFKDNKEFFAYLLIPIIVAVVVSKKRLLFSLAAVLISALVSASIGIVQVIIKKGISLDYRLKGLTSHWMTFAGLLMLAFIFFLVYLFYEKKLKRKIILAACCFLLLAVILLSQTRSVWVGIFVSIGIFIIYYKPKIIFIAIPAIVILFFLLPNSIKSRITSIVDPNNPTNKDRIYMVYTGIRIFKDFPITGTGPNNIENIYSNPKYIHPEAQQSNPHLHNNFLQVLAERGLLGLLGLLTAFTAIFIFLIRRIKKLSSPPGTGDCDTNDWYEAKRIAIASLFVFIGFLVAGLFEYNFGDAEIKFSLFYFLAIPFVPALPGIGAQDSQQVTPGKENKTAIEPGIEKETGNR